MVQKLAGGAPGYRLIKGLGRLSARLPRRISAHAPFANDSRKATTLDESPLFTLLDFGYCR